MPPCLDANRTGLLGRKNHVELERCAALALSARDYLTAFSYADRRCRIEPPPTSHCFVLRAEAAWRLGRGDAALHDLIEAVRIDPCDLSANRRLLAWADDDLRTQAAARLIHQDDDPDNLRRAIALLRENGEQHWAAVSVFDTHITGWVAWTACGQIEAAVSSEGSTLMTLLPGDLSHPLADAGVQATRFRLWRSPSHDPQQLTLSCLSAIFLSRRLPPNVSFLSLSRRATPSCTDVKAIPTVIVPVYADAEATISCFESLLKAGPIITKANRRGAPTGAFCVLAVDDATPNPSLRRYLEQRASEQKINLLVNPANLGFVGSVNRALGEVASGDVILLNADTLVPPGFVTRLAAAAHSQSQIGTATPLSNNGDIFSFPRAGSANPMPTYEEMLALDQAAAAANADTMIVTAPSGIGFCLYITRPCLDSVGHLSEDFERGYLEDVDFCLRAREKGFRNICASTVYVAHHGSKSFKSDKRHLVLRNLAVLDQRFPTFRKECLAFEASDPLRPIRARFSSALTEAPHPTVLIAAGSGPGITIGEARAQQISAEGERVALLTRHKGSLALNSFGQSSQETALVFDQIDDATIQTLSRLKPSRLEITDPNAPSELFQLAEQLGIPVDLWLTSDRSLLHVNAARRILAPTKIGRNYAKKKTLDCEIIVWSLPNSPLIIADSETGPSNVLAIVPSAPSANAWRAIHALSLRFFQLQQPIKIVVAGGTIDDRGLMAFPNVFVTGAVKAEELANLLAPYNPGWLLTDFEQPLFGHPLVESARNANRPVAFRDWAFGSLPQREHDLAISSDVSDIDLADDVAQWIARP